MTALPPSTDFTGAGITEGQFKTAITSMRDYLATLLGTTGNVIDALIAMGVPMSKTQTKTAAYTVIATDRGSVIEATSGTWTLSLTAAATLGDGFVFSFINSGSGTITIDPNASELIAGQATLTMGPGTSGTWYSNGTQWRAVASATLPKWPARIRTLVTTGGGSYTPPSDVVSMRVFVIGATGGSHANSGGGCGGPGYSEKYYATVSGSYSYAIGAGGTSAGTTGGNTTFGVMSVGCSGGVGNGVLTGGAGGIGSGGDFNATGGAGGSSSFAGIVGGGGGGAAGRWGNGSAGGASGTSNINKGGGGGGGSGGAGGAGGNPSPGAAGAAATTLSASSITGFDSVLTSVTFPAGQPGDSTLAGSTGRGGAGAPAVMYAAGIALGMPDALRMSASQPNFPSFLPSPNYAHGGCADTVNGAAGQSGIIQIWEYLS